MFSFLNIWNLNECSTFLCLLTVDEAVDKRKLVSKWHPTTKGTLRRNYRVPSKSEGRRLLKAIASLLSDDDHFVDATSHKVQNLITILEFIRSFISIPYHACYPSCSLFTHTNRSFFHSIAWLFSKTSQRRGLWFVGLPNQEGKCSWGECLLQQCESFVWWASNPTSYCGNNSIPCWASQWKWLHKSWETRESAQIWSLCLRYFLISLYYCISTSLYSVWKLKLIHL